MPETLPDGISFVAVCQNLEVRNALIRAIKETSGIVPAETMDSADVKRARYGYGRARAILNTASSEMHEKLGKHTVVLAVSVDSPTAAAHRAQEVFGEERFEASIHEHAEVAFPPGFIVFVTVPALEGIALVFWPKNPDPEILKTLPRPEPWPSE